MASPRREAKKSREQAARAARLAAQRRRRQQRMGAVLVVIALLAGGIFAVGSFNSADDNDQASSTTTTAATPTSTTAPALPEGRKISGTTPCPAADGSTERATTFEKAPPMCIDVSKTYTATFETSEGNVVVDLDTKKTPTVTNNFVTLARYHYYDGTTIFRTDPNIDIIQGGSPHTQDNSDSGPGYELTDEGTPFTYVEGDLVLANSGPNTSGGQYFFGTGPNVAKLDSQGTYLKFGHATQGLDVLKKIIALNQGQGQLGGSPSRIVTVNKVTITEK